MTIAQLERALDAKQQAAAAAYRETALGAERRTLSTREALELDALLAEGRAVKAELVRARGGDPWLDEIAALTPTPRAVGSLGAQVVADPGFRAWLDAGGPHRRIDSPVVAATAPETPTPSTIVTSTNLTVGEVVPMRPVPRLPTIASLFAQGRTTANAIVFLREAGLSGGMRASDPLNQGDPKPSMAGSFPAYGWTKDTRALVKVAGVIPTSEEAFDDVTGFADYINSRLTNAVDNAVDLTITNWFTLYPYPNLTPPYATQGSQSNPSAILEQAVKIAAASGYVPDGIAISWNALWATLAPTGQELTGSMVVDGEPMPGRSFAEAYLYGMRMVPRYMPGQAGTAIIGAFQTAGQVFFRDEVDIALTNSNVDDFTNDQIMIRGERRFAMALYCPPAFGVVTGLAFAS